MTPTTIAKHLALALSISVGLASGPSAAQSAGAGPPAEEPPAATEAAARPDPGVHGAFDTLLAEFVHDGVVDYSGLSGQRPRLRAYLTTLSEVTPADLDRDGRLAFWINAYNAFTLELILDHLGEIDSIKDISSGKRWKAERWAVDGRRYSLDEIEHDILRPMGEPRIHFALVCASFSCPDLRSEAYLPQTLDAQLDQSAREFLADERKGSRTGMVDGWFGGETPTLYLSKIFDWFEDDFEEGGGIVEFVRRHAPAKEAAFIDRHRADLDIEWFSYDWSLNGS